MYQKPPQKASSPTDVPKTTTTESQQSHDCTKHLHRKPAVPRMYQTPPQSQQSHGCTRNHHKKPAVPRMYHKPPQKANSPTAVPETTTKSQQSHGCTRNHHKKPTVPHQQQRPRCETSTVSSVTLFRGTAVRSKQSVGSKVVKRPPHQASGGRQ